MSYFVMLPDRTVKGPVNTAELGALAQQGLLTQESFVWSDGWPAWARAGTVAELVPLLASTPPAATTPMAGPANAGRAGRRVLLALAVCGALGLGFLAGRLWPAPTREPRAADKRLVLDNQRLLLEAVRFRGLASGKLDDALQAYGSPASLEFLRGSQTGRAAPQVWAYFFSGSQVLVGHARHATPILAFYHPFLDAALLTRWGWKGDRATIADAALWVGDSFPDEAAAPPERPRWMDAARATPLHEALLATQREFVSRFGHAFPIEPADASHFPRSSRSAEVQAFVEQQAAAQLVTLLNLRSHAGLARLRRALAESDAGTLDALIPRGSSFDASTLLRLPQELRARLLPSFAFSSASHTIVTLSLPEMPRFYVLAQFGTAESPLEHLSVQEFN